MKNEDVDIEGLYDVEMETGSKLDLTSGKLKALLESGAITEAQFKAMCEKLGYELEEGEKDDDSKKDDDTEMQQAAKSASPIKSLRFFAEL